MKIQFWSDANILDEGDVLVHTPTTLSAFNSTINSLREALAEVIVQRGEHVLQKEAKFAQVVFKLSDAGVEALQRLREGYMTVQQALEAQKRIAEAAAEAKAEQEGIEILKAVLVELAEEVWPNCEGCFDYDACGSRDEVPDIDLAGFYLD